MGVGAVLMPEVGLVTVARMALALAAAAVPRCRPLEFVSSAALVLLPKPSVSRTEHALGAEVGTPSSVATCTGDRGRIAKRPGESSPRRWFTSSSCGL